MSNILKPGDIVAERYEVIEILGEGAFGAVYRVKDRKLHDKEWALKELTEDTDNEEEKEAAFDTFRREAEILSSLKHPGLPDISDYFTEKGRAYIAMEIVPGENLEKHLEKRTLPLAEDEVLELSLKLCDILKYLHTHDPPVVFRDLKPSNIMIDETGNIDLIDFGIARIFEKEKLTDTLHYGTVGYAPPEQYGKQGGTDPRSDLYSLGALMHYLSTGRDPMTKAPFSFPPASELNDKLTADFSKVIEKLLAYEREDRYQTILLLEEDLKKVKEGISPEISPAKKEELIKADKKKSDPPIVRIALVVALLAVIITFYVINKDNIGPWIHEQKYYMDGKNYLEVVSCEPPSGVPIDPAKIRKITVKFNHPVNPQSFKDNFGYQWNALINSSSAKLSEDNTVLTVNMPPKGYDSMPYWFFLKKDLKDTRGNYIREYCHFAFRNNNPPDKEYGVAIVMAKQKEPGYLRTGRESDFTPLDLTIRMMLVFEEPYYKYPLMMTEEKPAVIDHLFPYLTLTDSEGKQWTSDSLKGKQTIFIIQRADGFIQHPDSMDLAKVVRTFFPEDQLQIVVCYISVDMAQLKHAGEYAGKGITVVSDLKGSRGEVFNFLANGYNNLPLYFGVDKTEMIKYAYTGLVHVMKMTDIAEGLGAKRSLPVPPENQLKELKRKIAEAENKGELYRQLGDLYEKAGNTYDSVMNYYEAIRYGVKDETLSRKVYDKFMEWGMAKQAFDVYLDNHVQDPADSERFYLAALAGIRMGHPSDWARSYLFDQFANLSTHTDHKNRKAVIFSTARYLAEIKTEKNWRYYQMGGIHSPNNIDARVIQVLTSTAEEAKEVQKDDPRPYRYLATYYDLEREYEKAYKELKQAENFKGFDDADRAFLAILAARTGKPDEGKKLAEEALKSISSANAHYALGKYYLSKSDYKDASEQLNKALMMEQWDPGLYRDYSVALEKTGKKKEAKKYERFAKFIEQENRGTITEIDSNTPME